MATLIPERLSNHTSTSVTRLFTQLRKLPDDFQVWHSFTKEKPHFLVLSPHDHAFLVHVASTTEELVAGTLQLDLLSKETVTFDSLAHEEIELLESFQLPAEIPIQRLLVFPNSKQDTLDQVVLQRSQSSETRFLGLKQSSPQTFLDIFLTAGSQPLSEPELLTLRSRFTPEAVIPTSSRPTLMERKQASDALPAFLDLNQEQLAKLDLQLPPTEERHALDTNARLITGPAGSGKSLVLLHRALLAARLNPEARLLILTHNKPINRQLRTRLEALAPPRTSFRWQTFFQWSTRFLPRAETILADHKVRARIATLHAQNPQLTNYQADFLCDEINFIRDLGIETLEDYLMLDRAGRSTALQGNARKLIWNFLIDYRAELKRLNETDWHERALAFYHLAKTSPARINERYDFIFIDEAQFFAAIWFQPVTQALADSGQLFLSADPTQGFLKRRQSWRGLGLDIVGRSHRLERVYRSTRPIISAARNLFLSRQTDAPGDDGIDLPTPAEISTLPDGETPYLVSTTSLRDGYQKTTDILKRQLEKSPWLHGQIILLHANGSEVYQLANHLNRELGEGAVHNLQAKHGEPEPTNPICRVASLQAATGLEAPVVMLYGLDGLLNKEASPLLTESERTELKNQQSRLLYMAFTRAIARLIIFTTDPARFDAIQTRNLKENRRIF